MADRFNRFVQLPTMATPAIPEAGYISLYGKNNQLAYLNELGQEHVIDGWTRKTSDFSTSSTTFVDVTGFTFELEANKNYKFEFFILFSTSNSVHGVGFAVNGPTSPTFCCSEIIIYNSLGTPITVMSRAYNVGGQSLAQDAANVPIVARVEGLISTGANAGTFALRFRGENAASTFKVLTGSVGRIVEVIS